MHRLDSWMNRQVGWRRCLLLSMELCPLVILAGLGFWVAFTSAGTPVLGSDDLAVAGWAALASVALAVLVMAIRGRLGARYADKPLLSAHFLFAGLFLLAAQLSWLSVGSLSHSWIRDHHAVVLLVVIVALLLNLGAVTVFVLGGRRLRLAARSGAH